MCCGNSYIQVQLTRCQVNKKRREDKGNFDEETLGKPPFQKSAVFFNIIQKAFGPPPFYLNICPILQGVFFHVVNFLNDAPPYTMARMSSPHLKCCINVGFREAPCKKSFGILASYWTPPKIK